MSDPLDMFSVFAEAVRARLDLGRKLYGTRSFSKPLPEVIEELRQEVLDQAAYAFIAWHRLEAIREALERTSNDPNQPRISPNATPNAPSTITSPSSSPFRRRSAASAAASTRTATGPGSPLGSSGSGATGSGSTSAASRYGTSEAYTANSEQALRDDE